MAGKKLMSVALCAAMVGTMVGAVTVHAESDYAGLKIEIVSKGFQHQYWQAVLKGAEEKAEELGEDTDENVTPEESYEETENDDTATEE